MLAIAPIVASRLVRQRLSSAFARGLFPQPSNAEGEIVGEFLKQLQLVGIKGVGFRRVDRQQGEDTGSVLEGSATDDANPLFLAASCHGAMAGSVRRFWVTCGSPVRIARPCGPRPRRSSAQVIRAFLR